MGVKINRQPAIPKGTYYLSIPPAAFHPIEWDLLFSIGTNKGIVADEDFVEFECPVFLPHGAVITEVVVYGNAAAEAELYQLARIPIDGSAYSAMAQANIGTADTTISNATIDNQNYSYIIVTGTLDTDDAVYGARITYTL